MKVIGDFCNGICVVLVFAFFGQTSQAQNTEGTQKKKINTISVPEIFFSGVLFESQEQSQVWYIPGAFELFQANTVEGFVFNPQVKFTQNYEDGRFFSLHPNLRYGFGNEGLQAQLKTQYFYRPKTNNLIAFSGGFAIEQLYKESTLSGFNNIIYTFLLNENFLKIYKRNYVEFSHTVSPFKDFLLTTSVSWNERNPLTNLDKYEGDEDFTSNAPENLELESTTFTKHSAILFNAQLRWQVGHQFTKQRGQMMSFGRYPALTLSYTHASDEILGSNVSYQKLAFSIEDDFKIGHYALGKLFLELGDFISKDALTFVDFKHFKGKETVYGEYGVDQFQLLKYYQNSTSEFYVQAHYEHYFRPFYIIYDQNRYRAVAGIHYLYTEAGRHYTELGLGMDNVLGNLRVDLYNSWRDNEYESFGVRIGFRID